MFREAFKKLDLAEVATVLERLNPEFDGGAFDPVDTTILAIDLPFYPEYRLLEIADNSVSPENKRHVIYGEKEFKILDFTNDPIYRMNLSIPVKINEETVFEYVRFFFSYVRGDHGYFQIIESVDDIQWKEEPAPATRKAMAKMIKPLKILKTPESNKPEENHYVLEASIIFKDAMFSSYIKIDPKGFVKIEDEEFLIDDIPVLDSALGQ